MSNTPTFLQDTKELLTADGFAVGDTWYHGTSSALVGSINGSGLRRSGDHVMNQAAKSTMATIGNNYTEQKEPVFLTQSKELAYYWAENAVKRRSVRVEGEEQPVVFEVNLPKDLRDKVRPDVGAAGLLMVKEGEHFMAHLGKLYQDANQTLDIDLMKADREDYLTKLGMAYIDDDIAPGHVSLLNTQ
jgi:hypothetical protein